jgi:hypothetical protein
MFDGQSRSGSFESAQTARVVRFTTQSVPAPTTSRRFRSSEIPSAAGRPVA